MPIHWDKIVTVEAKKIILNLEILDHEETQTVMNNTW